MVTNKTDAVRFRRFANHREFDNRPGTGRLVLEFFFAWPQIRKYTRLTLDTF